ncbi:hypothetical protein MASR2M74_20270 [Paracoccaceae bacterium]
MLRASPRPGAEEATDANMAITTTHFDYADHLEGFDLSRPDAIAEVIEQALRESGIPAEASDVLSHLKIELPTAQPGAASRTLAEMRLI